MVHPPTVREPSPATTLNPAHAATAEVHTEVVTQDSARVLYVADQDIDELGDGEVQSSYGFSLRATLDRLALFRIDVGFSEEGSNLTIAYGLSF